MKISVVDLRKKIPVRKKPWMVVYYEKRKPRRKFYATKEEAEAKAKDHRLIAQSGASPSTFSEAARLAAGTGYNIAQLVSLGLEHIKATQAQRVSPNATFKDGADLYFNRAKTNGARPATLKGYQANLRILNRTFGNRLAVCITDTEVRAYLNNMANAQGEATKAKANSRRTALTFIKGVLRILGIEKPLPGIPTPRDCDRKVEFFSIDQVRTLFQCARPCERGALALLLFAAIRPTLVERLYLECICSEQKTLTIAREIAKDKTRHVLETEGERQAGHWMPGLPQILWKWLEIYPFQPVKWAPFQKRLRKALGGVWIHDGTRHTGATYFAAIYGDRATSDLLTHETPSMAIEHYIGASCRADALAFYKLSPEEFNGTYVFKKMRKIINWPTDIELSELLKAKPACIVAKQLNCSDVALAKRCKRRQISKPGRGFWAKQAHGLAVGF